MKKIILFCSAICLIGSVNAQRLAINSTGTPAHPSAVVDIQSTQHGLLIPRVSTIARLGITDPAVGLWLYDTDLKRLWMYTEDGWKSLTQMINSPWTKEGSDIHYTQGKIGIGTTNISQYMLDYQDQPSSAQTSLKIINGYPNSKSSLQFYGDLKRFRFEANSANRSLSLEEAYSAWTYWTMTHEGNWGIATDPAERLHTKFGILSNYAHCGHLEAGYLEGTHLIAFNRVNVGPHANSSEFTLMSVAIGKLLQISSVGIHPNSGRIAVYNEQPYNVAPVELTFTGINTVRSRLNSVGLYSKNTQLGNNGVAGIIWSYGESGGLNHWIGYSSFNHNHGIVGILGKNNDHWGYMEVDEDGDGIFAFNIKNFVMDYPGRSDQEIWYASLEGPEVAAYTRGTATLINGKAVIQLPDHFSLLANASTMTVIVTPLNEESLGLAVTHKSIDSIIVEELGDGHGNYDFDWEVKCVRAGYEDFQVIRPKRNLSQSHKAE